MRAPRVSPALLRRLALALGVGGAATAASSGDADAIPLGPRARTAIPEARELARTIERNLLNDYAGRARLPENWRELFGQGGLRIMDMNNIRDAMKEAAHKVWEESGQQFGQRWSRVNSLDPNSPWRFEAPDTGYEVQLSRYLGDESPLSHRVRHPAAEAAHPERFRNTILHVMPPDKDLKAPSGEPIPGALAYAAEPWNKNILNQEQRRVGAGVIGFAPRTMAQIVPPPITPSDLRIGGKHHDTLRALLLHELTHRFNADIPPQLRRTDAVPYMRRQQEQMAFRAQHSLTMNNSMRSQTPFGLRPMPKVSEYSLQRGASRPKDIPDLANYVKRNRKTPEMEFVEREIQSWPGASFTTETTRGGHVKVTVTYNGRSKFFIAASTGSDKRGLLNMRRDMRHVLTDLGAVRIG